MRRFGLLTTFLIAIAIISWDEIKVAQRFPQPQRYVHAAVVWAILGIVADLGVGELAAVFGLGLVLSMLYVQRKATPDQLIDQATGRRSGGGTF